MAATRDDVLRALEGVIDPELKRSVVELDMVRAADVADGVAHVTIALTVAGCPLRASFQDQVERALLPLAGIERVELSFDVMTPEEKATLTNKLRGNVAERTPGISVDASTRVMGSLALSLCHLAAGRMDAVCSLKPARSVDIAAAQLLVRERGLAIDLPETSERLLGAPLDVTSRSRVVAGGTVEACDRLFAALA